MKRVLFTLLLASPLLQSCIGAVMPISSDHHTHKMDLEGYVERLEEFFYDDVRSDFIFDRKKYGGYETVDENTWKRVFNDYYSESGIQDDVTVIISRKDSKLSISISGNRTEGSYVTTISTPGDIVDNNGVFRIVISKNGIPMIWVEDRISDAHPYHSYSKGEL